ncbi:MAG: acyltransferase [Flectobacillus sp.]|nr:acyltransferase [Flectobacillus sp.]
MPLITKRNQTIDFLRTVAIMLTLFRHFGVNAFLYKIGWIGVDLFFVLSGFLVSGLLFNEHKKTGNINFLRFFVRRGLKIYPLFYLLIGCFILEARMNPEVLLSIPTLLSEVCFYKNYFGGEMFLVHTWSIDVEEHFYLILPLLLLVISKINSAKTNPFRSLPYIFIFVAIACLGLRIYNTHKYATFEHILHVSPTHLRLDSLFFGTLLSYFYNYHAVQLKEFVLTFRNWIILSILILFTPALIMWDSSSFMRVWGFLWLYTAFGGIVLLGLFLEKPMPKFMEFVYSFVARLGFYSYATYIVHWPLYYWFVLPRLDYLNSHYSIKLAVFICYVCASFTMGWICSRTIEIPFLKLRDRLYPSVSKAI